jgi:hypothetical protein
MVVLAPAQPLFDAWLRGMQSLLLQPPLHLLHTGAGATVQLIQQHVCVCQPAVEPGLDDLSGQRWSCFEVSCSRLKALTCMVTLLQRMVDVPLPGAAIGTLDNSRLWCDNAPGVLLVLEALTRGVLPHHVLCTECMPSSSSSNSSSSSRPRLDAAQHLRALFADTFDHSSQSSSSRHNSSSSSSG